MLSHAGTMIDEGEPFLAQESDEAGERWDILLWGVMAFALGMLSAWIGAMAWIAVQFLTV